MQLPSQSKGTATARVLLSLSVAVILGLGAWLLAPGESGTSEAAVIVPAQQILSQAAQAPLGAGDTGSFKGTVTFDGKAPELPPLVAIGAAKADPNVCAAKVAIANQTLVVNAKNNGIANVFIYLSKPPAGHKPAPPKKPVDIDQENCTFLPHAACVQANQTVNVMNDDTVPHNVHTNPTRNTAYNQLIAPKTRKGMSMTYKKPERLPVGVTCDIHNWMKAYQLVQDHPFMAVTDADGKFEIKDLPPGVYEFIVWQERTGFLNRTLKVTINAGKDTTENLKYGADKFSVYNGPKPKQVLVSLSE